MTQSDCFSNSRSGSANGLRIVLAGGSGHIGATLQRHFRSQGNAVRVLSRRRGLVDKDFTWWDGINLGAWANELNGADVLINLSGRSVDCRYTAVHRWEIMESRVRSTEVLGKTIQQLSDPPRVWLNASTATIYRHSFDRDMAEYSGEIGGEEPDVPRSWHFSIEVAKRWEEALWSSETPGTRKVAMRSAIMMSPTEGSAFDILLRLVRLGLGGTVGNGSQFVSWVHEADFVRAIDHLVANENISGHVNIASPIPLPNQEFMRELRAAWGTRVGLHAPRLILEIGAFLLRTESELVLKSRRVVPRRLLEDGFHFHFANWSDAARDLVNRWRTDRAVARQQKFPSVPHGMRIHERTK